MLLLKQAAKTRMVPTVDILSAISAIKKAKVASSLFLETLGGSKSPGRTWMLIFTAQVWLNLNFGCHSLTLTRCLFLFRSYMRGLVLLSLESAG